VTEQRDTLAAVAAELSKLMEPLRTELVAPRTRGFFAELGITLSDAQAATLSGALTTIVDKTGELITLITDIVAETGKDEPDWGVVGQKAVLATVRVAEIISALDTLADEAGNLAIPDADQIAGRIFNTLLGHYLDAIRGLNDVLEFIGLLEREDFNVDSVDPALPPYTLYRYDFNAIGDWLSDPAAKAVTLYGWDSGFDGSKLFPRLERLIALSGLPVFYDDTATPKRLDLVFLDMVPTSSGPAGVSVRLKSDFSTGTIAIPLGPDATLEVEAAANIPLDTALTIRTDGSVTFTPPSVSSFDGTFGARLIVRKEPPAPFIIFGQATGSRLEFGDFTLGALTRLSFSGGSASGQLDLSGTLNDGKVIIDGRNGDGFIGKILPGTLIEADFSMLMGVSTERGFYFSGSSALEVRLPVHIELGPVSIEALTLAAALRDGKIPISIGADIKALLGPLQAVVQNMGVTATLSFPPGNSGNLGAAQLDIGFKPPNGVGLRVQAGPITGGGFLSLDYDKGEYIGALELSFKGVFTLKAIGIINTKMPDGSKGFALLILVTAEFTPIQLGYGFVLIGVGGLLGLNRSLDSEALRLGVRTGGVSSVLFPPDVIGNIVRIVSDLKAFFPITQGHFIVAPMGKLGWGSPAIITLEIGIILDIPAPQLTIIGVLRLILPTEDAPVLKLQVNFAGGVDFDRGLIWFDASIFDSTLLVFVLSGDMALRIGWGEQKLFVISVGGFHPSFKEIPPDLNGMKRVGIALLSGNNPRLMAQTYFALTSNSFQSGARVELYAEAAGFNIYGFMGYDLLVQFIPFHFIANIYAGLALRNGTDVIAGIDVSCELSGPTPWRAKGDARFKILFFSISIGFDETWGEDPADPLLEPINVLDRLEAAVQDGRNWVAELPANLRQTVTLRETEPPQDALLLHPFGVLTVSQKVAPLGLALQKFGNNATVGDTTFAITWSGSGSQPAREEFAVGNFLKLSDSEKLSRKSFESMPSGLRFAIGDASSMGISLARDVDYEMSYVHRKETVPAGIWGLPKILLDVMYAGGSVGTSKLSVSATKAGGNGPAAVAVDANAYQVVTVKDLSPADMSYTAATQAEAFALRNEILRRKPELAGEIQVVARHELDMAGAA
jgi:hypothetical protein